MKANFFLQGCSALTSSGIYCMNHGYRQWCKNQSGPSDVKRNQVFSHIFPGFGKLQIADRLAFSAASLIFEAIPIRDRTDIGISTGTVFGSLSTDIRYMKSVFDGFPRPAWFSATLPSSPVAEVAIQFGLKGPNRVIVGGPCPGLCALDSAVSILASRKADIMLVVLVSALDSSDSDSAFITSKTDKSSYCYACLISADEIKGGLNYISTFNPCFCSEFESKESEKSYFSALTQAATEKKECRCSQKVKGFSGSLFIEKGK